MSAPIQNVGRNRRNVMTGAPDVRYSGGFFLGRPSMDVEQFPEGATEPTAAIVDRLGLSSAGYITSDGVSEAEDRSTEKILDWNLDVIDIVETDYSLQLTVTFAEAANAAVLRFIYGDENVTVETVEVEAAGGELVEVTEVHVRKGARQVDNAAIMFDIKGKGDAKGRAYADEVQVASVGEIVYNKQGLIQYQVTIDVLNDVGGDYLHTWLTQRGVTVSGAVSPEGNG